MTNNSILTIPVKELLKKDYYIPAYQRGYRWGEDQVKDLLEDIHRFNPLMDALTGKFSWYCLQPLVVRTRPDNADRFELIDGQQRMTTLFLIVHYINEMFRGKIKESEPVIQYETREESTVFLNGLSISGSDGKVIINHNNIDFHYISSAYQTIHDWVNEMTEKGQFKPDHFINVFLNHVQVIWYQTKEADAIAIFTRINSGKIPLTNAELIKALFLKETNFSDQQDKEKTLLKQLRISSEWDQMETKLQNQEFWLFLNPIEYEPETRIDLVFNLIEQVWDVGASNAVFRKFQTEFKVESSIGIEEKWNQVKSSFATLEEWFEDRDLFHKIGYLIATGTKIQDIFNNSKDKPKDKFLIYLNKLISKSITRKLGELEYCNRDRENIRKVLLLHNVMTLVAETQENTRFPFHRYKDNNGWDVEHIQSVKDKLPTNELDQKKWLQDSLPFIKQKELTEETVRQLNQSPWVSDVFIQLAGRIMMDQSEGNEDIDKNDLSNLALLSAEINRSYQNAIFPVKRQEILKREKRGAFVPICTKNVFVKLYSQTAENSSYWSPSDQNSYFQDMQDKVGSILRDEDNHE